MSVTIGLLGDRLHGFAPQDAIKPAVQHATPTADRVEVQWIPTDAPATDVQDFDGLWATPGAYIHPHNALNVLRWWRESRKPLLGTCSGFQHVVIEYARHVVGLHDATSEDYDATATHRVVTKLSCTVTGSAMPITVAARSRAGGLYGTDAAVEQYYCHYGMSPRYRSALVTHGLRISAVDHVGEPRILELPDHPFFVATLFVPQTSSTPGAPHPIVRGFVRAVLESAKPAVTEDRPDSRHRDVAASGRKGASA